MSSVGVAQLWIVRPHEHKASIDSRRALYDFVGRSDADYSLCSCHGISLERIVGTKAAPYVLWGMAAIFAVADYILIERLSQKMVIYIGVIGWILTVGYLIWFCDFGPGSFGHVSDDWVTSHKAIWEH
jgi:hypothetical protein